MISRTSLSYTHFTDRQTEIQRGQATASRSQVGSSKLTFERGAPVFKPLPFSLPLAHRSRIAASHMTQQWGYSPSDGGSCRTFQPPGGVLPSTFLQGQVHTPSRQAAGLSSRLVKGNMTKRDQACLHRASHEECWEICPSCSPQETGTVGKNTGWEGKQVLIPPCLCHS